MATCYPCSCSSLRASLLLFLSFIAIDGLTVLDDTVYRDCPSFDCGNGVNVSYPFWVRQVTANAPTYCGYNDLEITCSGNTPIFRTFSDNYTVEAIHKDNKTISMIDSDVLGQTCPRARHNVSVSYPLDYPPYIAYLVFLFNCNTSKNTGFPWQVLEVNKATCIEPAARDSYVFIGKEPPEEYAADLYQACNTSATVVWPVLEAAIQGQRNNISRVFGEAMNKGFELQWKESDMEECKVCEDSDGRCGYTNQTGRGLVFLCFCKDGLQHPVSCQAKGNKPTLQRMILIGATIALLVAACFFSCYFCIWRRGSFWTSKSSIAQTVETFLVTHGPLALTRYRYSEVKQMTDSFNVKLGQGGYGSVFRGKLQNGAQVAVKLLNESKGNGEEFINEVASIGRTNHINVVSLLGFCSEGKKRALIYEFMPNGSLEKFLFSNDPNSTIHLQWEQLFKIALGIARGLEYLHNGCKTRIVHFDIKPHNILLDDDFCPKISDFGLAKLCPPKNSIISSICARGTIGYIAPEVFSRNFGVVSSKSDVYSYGMMVLEMVGGRKNVDLRVEHSSEVYFPHWIYEHLDQVGNLHICGITTESEHIARKMVLVGLWCIQTNPAIRPAINRVVEMLEERADNLQMPPKPFICSPVKSETNSNISSLATSMS